MPVGSAFIFAKLHKIATFLGTSGKSVRSLAEICKERIFNYFWKIEMWKLYHWRLTGVKCTEIKMWKICTEEIKKNMFKCTEKYAQYKKGLWGWVKIWLK